MIRLFFVLNLEKNRKNKTADGDMPCRRFFIYLFYFIISLYKKQVFDYM